MIAVIFEVVPSALGRESYFEIAADLKPLLETIDGFISVERFQSLADPGKFLSLSFWRDEQAVLASTSATKHRRTAVPPMGEGRCRQAGK